MAVRSLLVACLGRAFALELVTIADYSGSPGDGGKFGGSNSNGEDIVLFGQGYYGEEPYVTLLDGYLGSEYEQKDADYGDNEDIYHVELISSPQYFSDAGSVTYYYVPDDDDERTGVYVFKAWNDDEAYTLPFAMPDQIQRTTWREHLVLEDDSDGTKISKYDDEDVEWSLTEADLGWGKIKAFLYVDEDDSDNDDDDDAVYVVGTVDDSSYRGVAKVDEYSGEVLWNEAVETDSGTPRLHWAGAELLLLSNSFYARVDGADGATLLLDETSGLWLPGEGAVVAAYDAALDVIYSAGYVDGVATVRTSDRATGEALEDLDFTDALDAADPGTTRSDYPEDCDSDDDPSDCTGSACPGFDDLECDGYLDDDDDDGVCCLSGGGCCFFNFWEWAENSWDIKGTPEITSVHVLSTGKVVVVGAFNGDLYDEDGYHRPFTAEFAKPPDASTDDSSSPCADSTSWYTKKADRTCGDYVAKKRARCDNEDDDGVYAWEACLESCGACGEACVDDADWYHKKSNKNCQWVKGKRTRCEKEDDDGVAAYSACRRTCQSCDTSVCIA